MPLPKIRDADSGELFEGRLRTLRLARSASQVAVRRPVSARPGLSRALLVDASGADGRELDGPVCSGPPFQRWYPFLLKKVPQARGIEQQNQSHVEPYGITSFDAAYRCRPRWKARSS